MSEFEKTNEHAPRSYQTGSTRPPKSHGGLIAFLLILVIFLGGIVSILGMMNIQLFRMVKSQNQEKIPLVARSVSEQVQDVPAMCDIHQATLGISGQDLSEFCEHYYSLPEGIYITQVADDSDCYAKGLRSGDILLQFNGMELTHPDELDTLLQSTVPGENAVLTYYRSGECYEITVVIGETG